MLSAMSCVAAAVLANTQFSHTELTGAETAPTVDTVQQYYMGAGRYVKINSLTIGTGVSNVVVGYQDMVADQGSLNDTCLLGRCTDQMSFEILNPFMTNATCLIKNFAEPDVNKTCALVLGTGALNVSDAITSVSSTLPYYFKSPGFNKKHFFIQYTILAGTTPTLSWNARVKDPEDNFCVAMTDEEVFALGGQIQPNPGLVRDRRSIGAVDTDTTSSEYLNNYYAWSLGISPAIELGCLQVYSTPLVEAYTGTTPAPTTAAPDTATPATVPGRSSDVLSRDARAQAATLCENSQYGTDFADDSITNTLMTVTLMDTYPCTVHTMTDNGDDSFLLPVGLFGADSTERDLLKTCCSKVTYTECNGVNLINSNTCFWNHQEQTCYPRYSSTSKDMKAFVGLNQTFTRTFQAYNSNPPKSTIVPTRQLTDAGYQVQNERVWHLVVTNPFHEGCMQAVDVSYKKSNTGGICEPSARAMCDYAQESCMKNLGSIGSSESQIFSVFWDMANIDDDEWTTCNCMKRKEVCYRKNGCLSTKKYELILQNCLEAGCGNYCNSGALTQVSIMALAFAVVAMLL